MVTNQAYLFCIFIINGIIIGVLFDFFRILRKTFKTSDLITYIEDSLFWILTGIIILYSIFVFNNGEITFNGYNSECSLDEIETSLWFLNGNRLTVTNTNFDPMIYEYEYVIESLTSDELILKETVSEPEGTFVYRSTFTRN